MPLVAHLLLMVLARCQRKSDDGATNRPQWRPRRLARLWRAPRRSRFSRTMYRCCGPQTLRMCRCQRRSNGCGRRTPRRPFGIRSNCIGGTTNARRWSRPQWRARSRPQWRTTAGLLGCKSAAACFSWRCGRGRLRSGFEAAAAWFPWSRGRRRMRRCRHKPRRCSSVHLGKAVGKSTCALGILIARSLIATYAKIHQRRGLKM